MLFLIAAGIYRKPNYFVDRHKHVLVPHLSENISREVVANKGNSLMTSLCAVPSEKWLLATSWPYDTVSRQLRHIPHAHLTTTA
ncbi:hypothetical protein CEXT_483561 [Caerostris extrusa]|uniref:Uncharacterized protein n=1 Tax=Caerostris extrusa TaxID=172846 RepID=A0AAV4VG01_CAEEX|nr:hypothetical protein CEXT_483561 [Caerostris extrusa]